MTSLDVPEVMFLGGLAAFSKIVDSFNAAITEIGRLGQEEAKGFTLSKERLLAILHLKLANCYLAESPHGDYRLHKDAIKAERHVRQALALDATFVFAKLSLAQLLHQQDRDQSYRMELFTPVFNVVKDIVSRTTETKILMMYYYIMVICCALGDIPHELPSIYAMRIHELVPKLPDASRIRIFSPLSKTDLRMDDFIRELKQFEERSRTERRPSERLSTHEGQGARAQPRPVRTVPRYKP